MIRDSEVDANSAHNANLPFILIEGGYTEKSVNEIKHNFLIKNYNNLHSIIEKLL